MTMSSLASVALGLATAAAPLAQGEGGGIEILAGASMNASLKELARQIEGVRRHARSDPDGDPAGVVRVDMMKNIVARAAERCVSERLSHL